MDFIVLSIGMIMIYVDKVVSVGSEVFPDHQYTFRALNRLLDNLSVWGVQLTIAYHFQKSNLRY